MTDRSAMHVCGCGVGWGGWGKTTASCRKKEKWCIFVRKRVWQCGDKNSGVGGDPRMATSVYINNDG